MHVTVDKNKCSGHGRCNVDGPDVYPLDDLGYVALDGPVEVAAHLADQARDGAASCPERAITVA
jgi:ferredoxin